MADDIQLLVNIDVPDLEAATKFYTEAFGFRVGRRFGPAALELLGAAVPLYLLTQAPDTPASKTTAARRTYERHWTPLHLDIAVPDIARARAVALAAGARAEGDISQHPWGLMALLADPFGHGVCLLEFRGQGYDAIIAP